MRQVFVVYDSKAEFYADPMYFRSMGEALRSWEQVSNDEASDIGKYAADFTFFHVGTYDEQTGVFEPNDTGKRNLGTALDVQKPKLEAV